MFSNVVIGLKEGLVHEPLLDLARKATPPPARMHLITLIRGGTQEDEPQRLERAEKDLENHASPLRDVGYEVTTEVGIIVVAAASELVRTAERHEADLIVIGLAKRTRVGKALMGSDAQRVLLNASCPVLSIPVELG